MFKDELHCLCSFSIVGFKTSVFDGNVVDVIGVVVVNYKYILIACAGGNRKATGSICKDFTGGGDIEGCRIAVMGSIVVWIRWQKERIINMRRVGNWFINKLGRTILGIFLCRELILSRLIETAFDHSCGLGWVFINFF